MPRVVIDCRDVPNEVGCTLAISGEEDEVVDAATAHAAAVHGHEDGPELREMVRSSLKPA
jgi:predicted small metal-binding protein